MGYYIFLEQSDTVLPKEHQAAAAYGWLLEQIGEKA